MPCLKMFPDFVFNLEILTAGPGIIGHRHMPFVQRSVRIGQFFLYLVWNGQHTVLLVRGIRFSMCSVPCAASSVQRSL